MSWVGPKKANESVLIKGSRILGYVLRMLNGVNFYFRVIKFGNADIICLSFLSEVSSHYRDWSLNKIGLFWMEEFLVVTANEQAED